MGTDTAGSDGAGADGAGSDGAGAGGAGSDGAGAGGAGSDGAALVREALRLCDRYVAEIVLAFGLCPWAEPVLRAGTLARRVLLGPSPTPAACLPIIDEWAAKIAGRSAVEVGFIIFPGRVGTRGAFDSFAEAVRRADRARRASSGEAPFVIAAFHPEGARQFTGPPQLVSFLRRTPDPLLQLVRADLLDRVKSASPGVSNQIAARNFAAMTTAEAARFDAIVRDIRADRDASYAPLGFSG